MSQINFHPAPGLGDLINGWFVVPQNPLRAADATVIVPSLQATAPGQILRRPRLGDFVAATFTVPQNPVAKNVGLGGCAGCGCPGSPCDGGGQNYSGLQGFDYESIKTWAQENSIVSAVPNWVLLAAAGAGAYFLLMPGGAEYRAARSEHRGYRRLARRYAN